jgi:glycosyltransferase involved in cell wall biosynthesis
LAFDFVPRSSFRASIYHCVDRLQAQPEMPSERIDLAEKNFCRAVGVVFTTSPELQRSLSSLNPNTHFFGNVADFNHFSRAWKCPSFCPEKLRNVPAPRLIFIGAIDAYKVDLEALLELAKKRPEWNIVLAGPVGEADPTTNIKQLQDCSNVALVGSVPYEKLPDWLSHADVALLPLLMNDYTKNMFPMKFFEYLAAGIPVVASAIPSLMPFSDAALLVEPDENDFEKAINLALSGHGPSQPERLSLAYRHTYIQRTKSMLNILEDCGLI